MGGFFLENLYIFVVYIELLSHVSNIGFSYRQNVVTRNKILQHKARKIFKRASVYMFLSDEGRFSVHAILSVFLE